MSRLIWADVQYDGKPHRAAVVWSWSGRLKRIQVVGMRLFTTDPTPIEIERVPTNRVSGLIDQLTPPETD